MTRGDVQAHKSNDPLAFRREVGSDDDHWGLLYRAVIEGAIVEDESH
jgi:hypothetical protein